MARLALNNVCHYFSDKLIMRDVSFALEDHHRIGLIGTNGCGKTTLLDIITGKLLPFSGTIHRQKKCEISFLAQNEIMASEKNLWTFVTSSYQKILELQEKIIDLEKKLGEDYSEQNIRLLEQYQNEYLALDGFSLETKAKYILSKLGFTETEYDREINSFSGGEKTRIQLATILLRPSDILLLDEPTNHLDIKMRNWLEKYLNSLTTPYIIVSHDRHFLDNTTKTILAFENKTIVSYSGNYSFYEKEYQLKQQQLEKEYNAQQKFIQETEKFINKNIAGQKTKQAQSRRRMLEKMELVSNSVSKKKMSLKFASAKRSGNIVFNFENLALGYPGLTLAKNIDNIIEYRDRVAIIGDNGCGKTTLIKLLLGESSPLSGTIKKGASITIGYYDQLHRGLDPDLTIRDTVLKEHLSWTDYELFSFLAKYGFMREDADKKVAILSGGEKSRLYLSLIIASHPNVLIMDEPTNHLDIAMIKSLESSLTDFDGTLIFVSHDRYFINNLATRFWLFNKNTIIEPENWEEMLLSNDEAKKNKDNQEEQPKSPKKINPIVLDLKMKEINELTNKLSQKKKAIADLESLFLLKDTYTDTEKVKQINADLLSLKKEAGDIAETIELAEEEYLEMLE